MTEPKTDTDSKQHFWVACVGLIIDRGSRKEEQKFNVIVRTGNSFLNEENIGYMQQSAQLRYHTLNPKAEEAGLRVVDAVINSVSYIGLMTDKEFLIDRIPEPTDEPAGTASVEPNKGSDTGHQADDGTSDAGSPIVSE